MLKGAQGAQNRDGDRPIYTDAFFQDCKKLNIKRPDVVEPATNCIGEYIAMVSRLLETGYAYLAGGNVYFDTAKLKTILCVQRPQRGGPGGGRPGGRGGGRQQAEQKRLCPLVHQVQI